jgi:FtsP/CotA-like multicopper oxidase with cupredoxin domain
MTTRMPIARSAGIARLFSAAAAAALLLVPAAAHAGIAGVTGTSFSLTARDGYISTGDGGSIYSWGYTTGAAMQLPGPTLIVTEGDTVTVTLDNALPAAAGRVSIVFPGNEVTTEGGVPGLLTQEAVPGGSVTYTFTASTPGTYQYHSGTRPDLQVEMGLYGALIVRPSTPAAGCTQSAYNHSETCFDREYLFLLSEIDIEVHQDADAAVHGMMAMSDVATEPYFSEYFLLNGRTAPDTLTAANDPGTGLMPNQPYNCVPQMHPGEKVLIRLVGVGRQMHPFHHHGNHSRVLARDGRLLLSETDPNKLAGPLLFTIPSLPGETVDAIYEWTGKELGWDMYGTVADGMPAHNCIDGDGDGYADSDSDYPWEWCPDHNRQIPVDLPDLTTLVFGGFWGGSPYLGDLGSLPPGEGGLNPNGAFTMIWHSHTEKELINNDVFPGGMMTFLFIEAPWVTITD